MNKLPYSHITSSKDAEKK